MTYRVHRESLLRLLKLPSKFPSDFHARFEKVALPNEYDSISVPSDWVRPYQSPKIPGLWTVVVIPSQPHRGHRIFVECSCGKNIPIGRLDQHKKACKED